MLTKDLLRVSRAGGGYQPRFAGREHRPLAARVIGIYQGHVGESRGALESALEELERGISGVGESSDGSASNERQRPVDEFKLVRGLAALLDRETTVQTEAPLEPVRARRAAFEAAEAVGGVASEEERAMALVGAGETLEISADDIATSLYADLEDRQIVETVDSRWSPDELLAQYNLSLAQTALFDATEIRVRSSDPKALISAIKRLRLMYEIEKTPAGREVVVTGPTHLFRATRRYGTRFARLLRTVAKTSEWRLEATIDDRGTERTMTLSDDDPVSVPDAAPVVDVSFDSGVESEFAARVSAVDLEWDLVREPEALESGTRVMIPDFAFDYHHADFRVYLEIMGFWTPEYVEKKLAQLANLEDVDMIVAVDESLGVGEEIVARDHRAIPYSGSVRLKDVADVLREFESDLVAESVASLPDEIDPDEDAVALAALAESYGVSEDALSEPSYPNHELVGRTLVCPAVLEDLEETLEDGMDLAAAEAAFGSYGISDSSAMLSRLGYRVDWEGLSGGTVRER
ncbi:hypothetical protein HALLA_14685 [Halostagnicola larsenii XH-48]|uniref:DUF790 family protein n=1 Tax=Halostagnicola larsenii XH-48 TaxID=797299 RepID=W0JMP4_9EURY|nr:DUF790 family protein [Halostagnicola larsenii]AHF99848.1 hypothetical protein HALLA_14685 [Halostagnicola larsenii XH-48]